MSTPSSSNCSASLTCQYDTTKKKWLFFHLNLACHRKVLFQTWSGRLSVWGTVTDNITDGSNFFVSFVRFKIWKAISARWEVMDITQVHNQNQTPIIVASSQIFWSIWHYETLEKSSYTPVQERTPIPSHRTSHSFRSQPAPDNLLYDELRKGTYSSQWNRTVCYAIMVLNYFIVLLMVFMNGMEKW